MKLDRFTLGNVERFFFIAKTATIITDGGGSITSNN